MKGKRKSKIADIYAIPGYDHRTVGLCEPDEDVNDDDLEFRKLFSRIMNSKYDKVEDDYE